MSDSDRCLLESLVSKDHGFLFLSMWPCEVFTTQACVPSFIQTEPSNSLTRRYIGVWLKAGLTNALSKGSTNLWDSWQSAASLSVLKNHWHAHLETSLLANQLTVWDKIVWTSFKYAQTQSFGWQFKFRKILNTLYCHVMYNHVINYSFFCSLYLLVLKIENSKPPHRHPRGRAKDRERKKREINRHCIINKSNQNQQTNKQKRKKNKDKEQPCGFP